ncbi:uncharacterized protein METZ01_LOCUS509558, partial [marine metagenome]
MKFAKMAELEDAYDSSVDDINKLFKINDL